MGCLPAAAAGPGAVADRAASEATAEKEADKSAVRLLLVVQRREVWRRRCSARRCGGGCQPQQRARSSSSTSSDVAEGEESVSGRGPLNRCATLARQARCAPPPARWGSRAVEGHTRPDDAHDAMCARLSVSVSVRVSDV